MKKNNLFYVMVFSGLSIGSFAHAANEAAFEDKPALSLAEWLALQGTKGMGGALGVGAGLIGGLEIGDSAKKIIQDQGGEDYRFLAENVGLATFFVLPPIGVVGGGYAVYKGAEWAAIRVLAKLHGVSSRIEAVSQFYNINVPQYRALLHAAEQKDQEQLLSAINDLYSQRFGTDWQERLQKLFKKYRRKGKKLVEKGSFSLEGDERDFVRMVELGAAMENLYSDTKPHKEAAIGFAKELYEDLGLLK